jgi:hypothetical protein
VVPAVGWAADKPAVESGKRDGGHSSLHRAAKAKMRRLDFEAALPLLNSALEKPAIPPKERAQLFIDLGITYVNLGENEKAQAAFDDALSLDAAVRPPQSSSPKILELYEAALARRPPVPSAETVAAAPPEPPVAAPKVELLPLPKPSSEETAAAPVREPAAEASAKAPSRSLVMPLVLGGVFAAGVAGGVGTALASKSVADDIESRPRDGASVQRLLDKRKTLSTISYVCYGAAAASAVAGVVFYVWPALKGRSSFSLVPGGATAGLGGSF